MPRDKASVLMPVSKYRSAGGFERAVSSLCNGLQKLGYKVAIGAFSFEGNPPANIRKVNLKKFRGLTPGSKQDDFDIIHTHETHMNYYSFLTPQPFVFHYHGAKGTIQKVNLKTSFLLLRRRISRIISVSDSALNDFTGIAGAGGISPDVIYNGVDTDFFNTGLSKPHTKGDPQLLFVGNLYRSKNVIRIICNMPDILKLYPNSHLQIVGHGEDYQRLKDKIKEKKLENRIELLGSISDEELRLRYSSCDIYISASKFETFDLPALEAMACGKPALLSDIPAHREILEASNAGKAFSLGDKDDISNAIRAVCDSKQSFNSNARKFALKCDWSEVCEKVSKIYDQLMT
jgi:glycosyltransferase involved in cell wall biosynthesis